jgi:hypothetical protein
MISSILFSAAIALGALAPDEPPTVATEREAYKSAAAAAGHDAAAHVRLALWCEAHGLSADRLEQLSQAILDQPSNALARGLLGFVRYRGQWAKPEDVVEQSRKDTDGRTAVDQYLERRARAPQTPDGQMKLAEWCESHRLSEQAAAHYHEVVRLDPSRSAVWKHLGYKKQGNGWVKPEQLAAERQEAIHQKQADKRWRTKLLKLRDDLQSKDGARRARAEQALADVNDPRAVPSIWAVFVTGSVRHQMAAIAMLRRIDGPSASNALAAMALLNPRMEVQAGAIEALTHRDPRDVVGRLISLVHKPLKYEVRPVNGPGSPGELFVEGERFNIQRLYENQTSGLLMANGVGRLYSPDVPFDPFSIQNMLMASGAWASSMLQMTSHGLEPTGLAPIDPTAAAQAAKAMAANPQNAAAILNQLQNNPYNRDIPLGYTFRPTDPSYQIPLQLTPHTEQGLTPQGPPTAAQMQALNAFAKQVQAQANNPLSPMGMAIQLGKLENNPAHQQANAALSMTLSAQQQAAQQDLMIGAEMARVQQANQNLKQKLAMDVQFLEWTNAGIRQTNARVLPVLKIITGLDLGIDRVRWENWWMDQLDLESSDTKPKQKPTYREYVTNSVGTYNRMAYSPAPERPPTQTDAASGPIPNVAIRACFGPSTAVHTVDGPRPVESLQVGDRVLCQNLATGELEYRPVLAVHRNKPAPTMRITAGRETIVATEIQRFWEAGRGWTMARDLKAGDRLRIVGGLAQVETIEKDRTQPVYSIDVADHADLFVGEGRFLVHDFGFVPAVPEPFDRPADVSPKGTPTRP